MDKHTSNASPKIYTFWDELANPRPGGWMGRRAVSVRPCAYGTIGTEL